MGLFDRRKREDDGGARDAGGVRRRQAEWEHADRPPQWDEPPAEQDEPAAEWDEPPADAGWDEPQEEERREPTSNRDEREPALDEDEREPALDEDEREPAWDETPVSADRPARQLEQDRRTLLEACIAVSEQASSGMLREIVDDALVEAGVERIEATGERFDPDRHEAVGRLATDDPELDGIVGATQRAGYRDGAEIIRHPEVLVYRHDPYLAPGEQR
jgi:hypothetical protein